MEFSVVAAAFSRLEATTKRLERTAILVELLAIIPDAKTMHAVVRFLDGKIAPDWEGRELGLAEKLVLKAIAYASQAAAKLDDGVARVTAAYHETGDLGLAAEAMIGATKSGQMSLFGPTPLTVHEVFSRLEQMTAITGARSQDKKDMMLRQTLQDATPLEARYITRFVAGRLRLGVSDMTLLDALAVQTLPNPEVKSVTEREPEDRALLEGNRGRLEAAYDRCSDLATVAEALVTGGLEAVDAISITLGIPLRPMAAERLKSIEEIMAKIGDADASGAVAFEVKYDGLRMQGHIPATGKVRLFSRRLEEMTDQFPDVQAMLREAHAGPDCIIEMECVAIDAQGRIRPFQDISRRRGRKTGLSEAKDVAQSAALGIDAQEAKSSASALVDVPVAVYVFDVLAVDGQSTMAETYQQRRERISKLLRLDEGGSVHLSHMQTCTSAADAETWFLEAVEEGGEGVMAKRLSGRYKAGNRGFDWIKYKTDYTSDLVDTMDLVVVGAFHGRGRRAGWYGALLMAARDEATQSFASVCKVGTGFDDATLISLPGRLDHFKSAGRPAGVETDLTPDVWFEPSVVAEIQAAELSLSPVHHAARGRLKPNAGIAARFPRFTGWRDDKSPQQATTVDELVTMYEAQARA